ncbi:hypothetical protein HMPREF9370_1961 [Neisseria wadsworthii 9715]|uniref:Uncharacterized protein n=1 Tax=Neisseria wadsworthii 9715 TaxID=1030841 RepID=G4CSA1_9NEIS|nr:hypothetical protein HMPREF9370_1961 [Neisseria wadsworthii 9715]
MHGFPNSLFKECLSESYSQKTQYSTVLVRITVLSILSVAR